MRCVGNIHIDAEIDIYLKMSGIYNLSVHRSDTYLFVLYCTRGRREEMLAELRVSHLEVLHCFKKESSSLPPNNFYDLRIASPEF